MTTKLLRILFSGALLISCSLQAQTPKRIEKSIAIDYGYENIGANDMMGQMMFAKKHLVVYADADYFVFRTYSVNANPKSMDALLLAIIKDLKSGKVYSCMTVGDQKLRQLETEDSQLTADFFGSFNDTSYTLTKTASEPVIIQQMACDKWHLSNDEMVSPFLYLAKDVDAVDPIKNLPMFVQRDGRYSGLYLGNDTEFGGNSYSLRAQKVEIDQLQPIARELATYRDSNMEEMNQAIKTLLGF